MARIWREHPEARGGCQCGRLRYHIAAGRALSSLCHCRMCQRATGNAFAPLLQLAPETGITWQGQPAEWASSNVATRGFCRDCGTPLYYRSAGGIEIMAGTLTPDFPFRPDYHTGSESRVGWLQGLEALPDLPALPTDTRVQSHQPPEIE